MQPTPRRWPWVLLALALALIVADQCYRLVLRAQIRAETKALHQAGYPVGAAELQNWRPQLPDRENAALRIMEAANCLELGPDAFRNPWPGPGEELGPDERDALREVLTNNAPALETVHLAAQLKQSRFPLDYSRGPALLLPHLAKIKGLTQLLRASATLRGEEGQPDLAVRSILDSVALARDLDEEPLLISQLVRNACLSITCSSLERLLSRQALTEAQLTALSQAVHGAREASQAAFASGYLGEIGMGVYCFNAPPGELFRIMNPQSEVSPWIQALYPLYAWTGLRDRDYLFFLRTVHHTLEIAKAPFPQMLVQAREAAERNTRELERHKLLIFSRMLLPALQKTTNKDAELEARLRCAEAALAVERQRVTRHASIPDALAQLNGFTDPVDGAALRWRKLNTGYAIYSIGVDGVDNGGAPRESPGSSGVRKFPLSRRSEGESAVEGYDITFSVER